MPHRFFLSAVFWNIVNVFLYKIILQTHQACLFYIISAQLFGISGTLFSTIYLVVGLTNFGFDYSLFTFHRYYIRSKQNFKKFIPQFLIRTLSICFCVIFLWLLYHINPVSLNFITQYITPFLLLLIFSIFVSESLKKSLEIFAQLSFLNKTITITEVATLAGYVLIVWGIYAMYGFIDIYVIFIPMALMSWIELLFLIWRMKKFYATLPSTSISTDEPNQSEILHNQAINYINQIAKSLFSPNFMIIFLAYHLGMTRAGYIKLIIDIIILLYMLLNRSVGLPSAAILSISTSPDQTNVPAFKTTFLKITNGYIQFLYILATILIFTIGPCLFKLSCIESAIIINILLFAFAGFLEYIIITYEKLYLTQGATKNLAAINLISLTGLIITIGSSRFLPLSYLLLPFIVIRLCSTILIASWAYKTWLIHPDFKIRAKTAALAVFLAIILLFWHFRHF